MFPADGLNREGDMSLNSEIQDAEDNARRHAMPFCPGCRKYHREGHQFCENYPLTPAEMLEQKGNILEQQGNAANTDPNNLRDTPRLFEEKKKFSFTKEQLEDVERIAEARGFNIATKAISIVARQLLGPNHQVMQVINTLKGK